MEEIKELKIQDNSVAVFYYVVPFFNELEAEEPNVFFVRNENRPNLGKIKEFFPLFDQGEFHWRFKQRIRVQNGWEITWEDALNDDIVPMVENNVIYAKLVCLNRVHYATGITASNPTEKADFPSINRIRASSKGNNHQTVPTRPQLVHTSSARSTNLWENENSESEKGIFDSSLSSKSSTTKPKASPNESVDDIVKRKMDSYRKTKESAEKLSDLKQELSFQLRPKVDKWRLDSSGMSKNIRSLLSSLQDVLWENVKPRWKTSGLLVTNDDVKRFYKKAVILVHPDKVKAGSTHQEQENAVLAHLIFDTLNQQYKEFEMNLK